MPAANQTESALFPLDGLTVVDRSRPGLNFFPVCLTGAELNLITSPRLTVEPLPNDDMPDCPCCDGAGTIAQGFVYAGRDPYAAYVGGLSGLSKSGKPLLAIAAGSGWEDAGGSAKRRTSVFRTALTARGIQFRLTTDLPSFWPDFATLGRRLGAGDSVGVAEMRSLARLIVAHDEKLAFLVANRRSPPAFSAEAFL